MAGNRFSSLIRTKPNSAGPSRLDLTPLLRPRSIAIIGASDREGSFGQRLLQSITGGRYTGRVYPINPRYRQLKDLPCYPNLAALPESPDLAAFAISDDVIEAALTEAAEASVKAAALFGRAWEPVALGRKPKAQRLGDIGRAAGMAVLGNNCMGFINFVDGLKVSGNPPPLPDAAHAVGLVSHSGSTWSGLIGNQRQLPLNYAVSSGQEIVTTAADYIDFLLAQPETRAIGCILETVRDPEGFIGAIEAADRKGVPVVVLKLGRSEQGRALALAHSGALAGSDSAYAAVFERHNVVRVHTPDELCDTLELFACPRRPAKPGIGVVTNSGGERELIVDLAADIGAPLAKLTPASEAKLERVLDPGMETVNPVNSYGDGRMLLGECLQVLAEDENVGIAAMATNLVHGRPYLYQSCEALERVFNATIKPTVVFGNIHSAVSREEASKLRSLGIPVLMGTATALAAMKHLGAWQQRRERPVKSKPIATEALPERLPEIESKPGAALPPEQAFAILEAFGIPVAKSAFIDSKHAAQAAARALGFPVVLKTAAADIRHKTERGGVALGLADAEAAGRAYDDIARRCGSRMQVQTQAAAGVEVLLGMTCERPFGPMLTIALGGILTEVLADAVTVQPPVSAAEAAALIRRLKGYRLLVGYRDRPTADLDSLCQAIAQFSQLCTAIGSHFSAIDVNPVIAGPAGAMAVDALMILA